MELLNITLHEVDDLGELGGPLTKVHLPTVPEYEAEIIRGDPADHFVVRGPAVFRDGTTDIALGVEIIAMPSRTQTQDG